MLIKRIMPNMSPFCLHRVVLSIAAIIIRWPLMGTNSCHFLSAEINGRSMHRKCVYLLKAILWTEICRKHREIDKKLISFEKGSPKTYGFTDQFIIQVIHLITRKPKGLGIPCKFGCKIVLKCLNLLLMW